ncbi:hypothetical protein J6590_063320 [Homalodisca vitripennis]|nr:hypothetical protein J6590_063320 [Homalodisca vitripennis]
MYHLWLNFTRDECMVPCQRIKYKVEWRMMAIIMDTGRTTAESKFTVPEFPTYLTAEPKQSGHRPSRNSPFPNSVHLTAESKQNGHWPSRNSPFPNSLHLTAKDKQSEHRLSRNYPFLNLLHFTAEASQSG